jgi:hypothetical protein
MSAGSPGMNTAARCGVACTRSNRPDRESVPPVIGMLTW